MGLNAKPVWVSAYPALEQTGPVHPLGRQSIRNTHLRSSSHHRLARWGGQHLVLATPLWPSLINNNIEDHAQGSVRCALPPQTFPFDPQTRDKFHYEMLGSSNVVRGHVDPLGLPLHPLWPQEIQRLAAGKESGGRAAIGWILCGTGAY